jgi:23S rRNA maturation mini-RNase III
MQEIFQMGEVDIKEYSPLTLAYIGDSIYDLIIKSLVVNRGNKQVNKLHHDTAELVQAKTQSLMMRTMQEHLTEEENAKLKDNYASIHPWDDSFKNCDDMMYYPGINEADAYVCLNKDCFEQWIKDNLIEGLSLPTLLKSEVLKIPPDILKLK